MKFTTLISAVLALPFTSAFNLGSTKASVSRTESDRRAFLKVAFSVATASVGIINTPSPALADVSDGTALPEGAKQFKRLINLKSDIPLIVKRVTEHADEIDKKEWDNLSDFLRRVYKGGDDMKNFTKTGIYDPEKKKKAEEDVKLLQKLAQAGDGPVGKADAKGYATILTRCEAVLEDFFDLLRDVPDEI